VSRGCPLLDLRHGRGAQGGQFWPGSEPAPAAPAVPAGRCRPRAGRPDAVGGPARWNRGCRSSPGGCPSAAREGAPDGHERRLAVSRSAAQYGPFVASKATSGSGPALATASESSTGSFEHLVDAEHLTLRVRPHDHRAPAMQVDDDDLVRDWLLHRVSLRCGVEVWSTPSVSTLDSLRRRRPLVPAPAAATMRCLPPTAPARTPRARHTGAATRSFMTSEMAATPPSLRRDGTRIPWPSCPQRSGGGSAVTDGGSAFDSLGRAWCLVCQTASYRRGRRRRLVRRHCRAVEGDPPEAGHSVFDLAGLGEARLPHELGDLFAEVAG
jgi:hypothetical protein